jgi:hypothetical protein
MSILSLERICQLLFRPGQAQADRIRRRIDDKGDLPRLQLLPRPEIDELSLLVTQLLERSLEMRIAVIDSLRVSRDRSGFGGETVDEAEAALIASPMIAEDLSGHAVAPWKTCVGWNLVETTPHHHQRLREDVVD